jgi:GATA-binding protein
MKKAIIKRRKRVIPVAQGGQDDGAAMESVEQQSQHSGSDVERGSLNDDGSVNLGLRRKQEQQRAILPQPVRQGQGSNSLPSSDLTAYHNTHTHQSVDLRSSLTDDNRLAPLTSISVMSDRQSSLSPASFLSPSRKRSFSTTGSDTPHTEPGHDSSKRLSSIKSILNPSGSGYNPMSNPMEDAAESLRLLRSPASTMASAASPGSYSVASSSVAYMQHSEGDKMKAEKRVALQQEAERIRAMLAAKERELAALEE